MWSLDPTRHQFNFDSPVEQRTTETPELFSPNRNQNSPQSFQHSPAKFSSNNKTRFPSRNILSEVWGCACTSSPTAVRDSASQNSPTFVKDLFSKIKLHSNNISHFRHRITYMINAYSIISFILRTSLRQAFHTSWHCMQLTLYLFRKDQSINDYQPTSSSSILHL